MAKKSSGEIPAGIDKNWRAEDDLRTMMRACEIRKDKSRMAEVKKLAVVKKAELEKVMTTTKAKY